MFYNSCDIYIYVSPNYVNKNAEERQLYSDSIAYKIMLKECVVHEMGCKRGFYEIYTDLIYA